MTDTISVLGFGPVEISFKYKIVGAAVWSFLMVLGQKIENGTPFSCHTIYTNKTEKLNSRQVQNVVLPSMRTNFVYGSEFKCVINIL
jgi:hypothetical protein